MNLNLPIAETVAHCKNVLIAGMGGGFDVFCGLPLYFDLKDRGCNVHLANLSFSDIFGYTEGVRLSESLKGVGRSADRPFVYFPELYLSQWLSEAAEAEVVIWCFQKTGAAPLVENYGLLTRHLGLDCIVLVDGGVDSLVRGDEPATGTLIEDATSLLAVSELQGVPTRLLCCVGLGAEPDLSYYHILENIAALTATGGFLGSCSLAPGMECFKQYQAAVEYAQGRPLQDPSVINSSIVSSVQGHYGNWHMTKKTEGSRLWISPLMGIYWFFDLMSVARQNLYLGAIRDTQTFMDAMMAYMTVAEGIPRRQWKAIPLP